MKQNGTLLAVRGPRFTGAGLVFAYLFFFCLLRNTSSRCTL